MSLTGLVDYVTLSVVLDSPLFPVLPPPYFACTLCVLGSNTVCPSVLCNVSHILQRSCAGSGVRKPSSFEKLISFKANGKSFC